MLTSIDHPTAVGHWRIRGGTLRCRLPGREVTARAPQPLLRAVRSLCDGRLDRQAVVGALGRSWSPSAVAGLLQGLNDQGLLLDRDDAAVLCAPAHRTFGDAPFTLDQLQAVLQSAALIAGSRAGRLQVEVLRPLPDHHGRVLQPGCYAAVSIAAGTVLQHLPSGETVRTAWHILPDPRVLTFASVVLLAYAGKGRAESMAKTDLALLAARRHAASTGLGHALFQNLPANPSGQRHTTARKRLSALVLGTVASSAEADAQQVDRWLPLGPAADRLKTPTPAGSFAFSSGPVPEKEISILAVGRAADPLTALHKAEAEAWERLGWARPGPLVVSPLLDLHTARDPRQLVAYADWQHERAAFPFARFDPARPVPWCEGVDVSSGARIHLPAEYVHALQSLPARWRRHAGTSTSTSGAAAGPDSQTAFTWALLELIERDAFLRAWIAGNPARVLATVALPAHAQHRVRRLRAQGHRVSVLHLSALAPVFGVLVQSRRPPFTVVTAGAHFDPVQALGKALDEAEGCAAHAATHAAPPPPSMGRVSSLADLRRYWQSPLSVGRADFLASGPPQAVFLPHGLATDGRGLLADLASFGAEPMAFDVTPTGAAVDQGRTPLRVVRAAVPGLLPIWFGHGLEPAGLPAFRAMAGHRRRPIPIHPFA